MLNGIFKTMLQDLTDDGEKDLHESVLGNSMTNEQLDNAGRSIVQLGYADQQPCTALVEVLLSNPNYFPGAGKFAGHLIAGDVDIEGACMLSGEKARELVDNAVLAGIGATAAPALGTEG